jgi:hypothetical protein
MARHSLKAQRELAKLASEFDLEPIGWTGKAHLKWRHVPTGRIIITVSGLRGRVLQNQKRDIKQCIRRFMGDRNGHAQPH